MPIRPMLAHLSTSSSPPEPSDKGWAGGRRRDVGGQARVCLLRRPAVRHRQPALRCVPQRPPLRPPSGTCLCLCLPSVCLSPSPSPSVCLCLCFTGSPRYGAWPGARCSPRRPPSETCMLGRPDRTQSLHHVCCRVAAPLRLRHHHSDSTTKTILAHSSWIRFEVVRWRLVALLNAKSRGQQRWTWSVLPVLPSRNETP